MEIADIIVYLGTFVLTLISCIHAIPSISIHVIAIIQMYLYAPLKASIASDGGIQINLRRSLMCGSFDRNR
ncbi:hypothetical protein BDV41DRAFT_522607 [Aspergillus transmontanensis]|uniref:Uncharacterized protein n=1 Tax=Aspergillus transmontanensis TaxID=1034304 RepID=A0A5N6WC20_9EURO|nr:hypothetical protein BDV41DRAFT_522607 [Aspergillus transmontanensis]